MKVYTGQLAQWRYIKSLEIETINATYGNGDRRLAPSGALLAGYQQGVYTPEEYTERYYALMRSSYTRNRERWEEILAMEEFAVLCFCGRDQFCHRHLFADILEAICKSRNIPFERGGELFKEKEK